MAKRSYTPEKIINKFREVEVFLSQGLTIGEAGRKSRSSRTDPLS